MASHQLTSFLLVGYYKRRSQRRPKLSRVFQKLLSRQSVFAVLTSDLLSPSVVSLDSRFIREQTDENLQRCIEIFGDRGTVRIVDSQKSDVPFSSFEFEKIDRVRREVWNMCELKSLGLHVYFSQVIEVLDISSGNRIFLQIQPKIRIIDGSSLS